MNINKLKGKIVEKGMNITQLAFELGINRATLYRKINNQGDTLTIKEANVIVSVLELTEREATEIFFTQFVALNAN